jgi:hypothetical protein
MIQEPCKIGDSNNTKFSYRPNYTDTGKIKLKPFITDYNRVNNYLSNHMEDLKKYSPKKSKVLSGNTSESNINDNAFDQDLDISLSNIEEKIINKKYFYLQPVMKFAPRTEFERIYDTLNSYNFGSVDKDLIQEQLKTLGFLTIQNNKSIGDQNEYSLIKERFKVSTQTLSYLMNEKSRLETEPRTPEINDLINNITEIIKINKSIMHEQEKSKMPSLNNKHHRKLNIAQKKIINNYLAKNILSEYQKKTHFKALLNFTLNLEEKNKNKKYRTPSINDRTRTNNFYKKNDLHDKHNNYKNLKIYDNNGVNIEKIIKSTCFKPFHTKKEYPKEDMEYLKKLCMTENKGFRPKNNLHKQMNDDEDEQAKNLLKPSNTVIINGVIFNKNRDLDKISKAILKECNYIKNYYDKENAGDGKTMITRGLSVNEFAKKYRLPK